MNSRQFAVVCVLVAVGAGALAVPSVAFHTAGVEAVQVADDSGGSELGLQVSSFAQASATDASESVEAGIWEVRANTSAEPEAEIRDRAATLERRLERLQERIARLEDRRENLSEAAYTARASALRVQAANIRSHIEQANETAARKGVNATALNELRGKAANMTGPEIAEAARNITDTPRGPPGGVGPPVKNETGPPSETPGRGNGNGPPENRTGMGDGPPENRTEMGDGTPGQDRGQSNDTARNNPGDNRPSMNDTARGQPGGEDAPGNASSGERGSGQQDGESASPDRGRNDADSGTDSSNDRGSNGSDASGSENRGAGSSGNDGANDSKPADNANSGSSQGDDEDGDEDDES